MQSLPIRLCHALHSSRDCQAGLACSSHPGVHFHWLRLGKNLTAVPNRRQSLAAKSIPSNEVRAEVLRMQKIYAVKAGPFACLQDLMRVPKYYQHDLRQDYRGLHT